MSESSSSNVAVWNKVLATAMAIPGVKVERQSFLTEKLMPYCSQEQIMNAINGNPTINIDKKILDHIADAVISRHTTAVSSLSFIAGLPGGWTMAASIPADIAQYYWHTLVLSQKLAYIYGWPDLLNEHGELTDDAVNLLTIFIGVMSGVAAANEGINAAARALSKQIVKRLPQKALTKTVIYPIAKKVAAWFGVKLTKDSFAKGLSKVVPIVGGVISGVLTLFTFRPGARRLKEKFIEQAHLFKSAQPASPDNNAEDTEYEEVQG